MTNKSLTVGLIAVAIIAIIALFTPFGSAVVQKLGGTTNYDEVDTTALKVGGTNGSRVGPMITGTCSLLAGNMVSVAASTTFAGDCAVTGVVSGDIVWAQFATSTALGAGWQIVNANASTTAGFITFRWINNTGAAATIPQSVASSTEYLIMHPVASVPGL